jgi:hypothetical protein
MDEAAAERNEPKKIYYIVETEFSEMLEIPRAKWNNRRKSGGKN